MSGHLSFFDRFATTATGYVSRAWFFALCVLLILVWAPSIALIRNIDTWQLIINTATTIVTFLLVALLQNSQTRADAAVQHKLNAIADALADLMHAQAGDDPKLREDMQELKYAVGLERREGS
ncbi:MAG TPA: low affinity iron permease family protein [Micromonosporaceae bacterium]|nr:low affinity iron permease family protein [Micromonosporaceae bacterium]